MAPSAKKPFDGFEPLNKHGNLFLYRPSNVSPTKRTRSSATKAATDDAAPGLIIMCTWMAALPKHITKYVVKHQELFPSASILILTDTVGDIVLRPNFIQQRRIAPAVEVIRAAAKADDRKILLHVFSNGGSQQALQLAIEYRRATGEALPVSAMALDSTPGRSTWSESYAAFNLATPPPYRAAAQPVIYFVLVLFVLWRYVLRMNTSAIWIRAQLLNERHFPKSVPRVYMYSKGDEIVGWRAVLDHAAEAKEQGWGVETVEFEGSKHVNHMQTDERRYWDTVKTVLAAAE